MSDHKEKQSPKEIDVLVREAQKGNTDAFAKLYDHFIDPIYRYIYFRVNKEEALDLTENVFLKVWENLGTYKAGKGYFSSWVYRIAHNLVVDHYRLGKETAPLDDNLADDKQEVNPAFITEQKLNQEMLRRAIKRLKKKYQQIIVLTYINDLDNHEIARVMRRTEGNLRILKFRALKALRSILEEMEEEHMEKTVSQTVSRRKPRALGYSGLGKTSQDAVRRQQKHLSGL